MPPRRQLKLPPVTPPSATPRKAERFTHGTVGGYTNHGCRCEPCRMAYREYARARAKARRGLPIPERVHGTVGGYTNWHCRCDRCTGALRDYAARKAAG